MDYIAFEGTNYEIVDAVSKLYAERHNASWLPQYAQDMHYQGRDLFTNSVQCYSQDKLLVTSGSPVLTLVHRMCSRGMEENASLPLDMDLSGLPMPSKIVFLNYQRNDRISLSSIYQRALEKIESKIDVVRLNIEPYMTPKQVVDALHLTKPEDRSLKQAAFEFAHATVPGC